VVPRPSLGTPVPPPPISRSEATARDDKDLPRNRKGPVILVLVLVAVAALVVGLVAANGDDGDDAATTASTLERERATTSTTRRTTTTTARSAPATAPTTPTTTAAAAATPSKFGDDPTLDALYTKCGKGDYAACDSLYRSAKAGTAYRQYGDTCGNRNAAGSAFCTEIYAPDDDPPVVTGAPQDFGDDPHLDSLWTACGQGDMASCDRLYYESGQGTKYEEYGDTCGYRNEPSGLCTELYP
jgi:hypothetical protein